MPFAVGDESSKGATSAGVAGDVGVRVAASLPVLLALCAGASPAPTSLLLLGVYPTPAALCAGASATAIAAAAATSYDGGASPSSPVSLD